MLYDLCIVGAGMFGSAAARHASANVGLKIVLIGPDDSYVYNCHADEGRIVRKANRFSAYQYLSRESISRFRELERLSGIQFYHPVGFLYIDREGSSNLKQYMASLSLGKIDILPLSQVQLKIRFPFMKFKPEEIGFLDDNGSGYISPRNMVKAQKKVAEMQGCTIINDTVIQIQNLERCESQSYHKVLTNSGTVISSKRVLVCTGALTKFMNVLSEDKMKSLESTISKETVALLKISKNDAERLKTMPSIVHRGTQYGDEKKELNSYELPPIKYPDGNYYIKIGHLDSSEEVKGDLKTKENVCDWYKCAGNQSFLARYSRRIMETVPNLNILEVKHANCVCCYTPSTHPYIDRLTPTICVAFAGNGRGATTCEEVGRIAAELSVNGKWDSPLPKSLFEIVYKKE